MHSGCCLFTWATCVLTATTLLEILKNSKEKIKELEIRIDSHTMSHFVQASRTSKASLVKGRSQANAVAQQALIAHWQSIVKSLNSYLMIMKANYVSHDWYNVPFLHRECQQLWSSLWKKYHSLTCHFAGASLLSAKSVHSDILIHKCSVIQ